MTTLTLNQFSYIPEGTELFVDIVNVEQKKTPFNVDDNDLTKGKVENISFRFKVLEKGEYENRTLWGNTSIIYNDKSKLGAWVKEILASDTLPTELTLEDLIGLQAMVIIGNKFKEEDGEMVVYKDFVDQVVRLDENKVYEEEDF